MSCLGRCSKRPSHNILINRSIVHAISLHVSEVPFSSVVSAHTIVCVYVLCTHYVCVPRPSVDSAVCVQARNRICSKIKQQGSYTFLPTNFHDFSMTFVTISMT